MSKYAYILALVLASWVLFGNNAVSKTPDGATPAEEDVCDSLTGAAYGLCVSYCEAMDCGDANQHSDDEACLGVKANYQRIEGTNKAFPCECGCNYYLVPPTTECLDKTVYNTLDLIMEVDSKDPDNIKVTSSIMATDQSAEVMYQDVVIRPGGTSTCEVMVKGDNACLKDAQNAATEKVELKTIRAANACQHLFAQYTRDAIANGVLVEIQAVKSSATISTVPVP